VTILNNISSFGMIFLFAALILLYPTKIITSYGQIHFISDKSAIMQTTDCINSMITSVFMGSNTDCSNNNSKKMNFTSNDIHPFSKTDPFNFGSQNNKTSDFLAMNHGLVKGGSSLSLDDPSMFTKSLQQNQGLSFGNTSSLHPTTTDGKIKGGSSLVSNNDIGNLLDKNKHGKEIFACFNRAIASTNNLADSAIIKCAKDHSSFK
jgi:hypothetical protein